MANRGSDSGDQALFENVEPLSSSIVGASELLKLQRSEEQKNR